MDVQVSLLGALTIAGRPEHLRAVRTLVARALGRERDLARTAALLTSELVGNSMQHSDSRLPGGRITVRLLAVTGGVRVEVTDGGGATVPALQPGAAGLAEGGRGLLLVSTLADRWGFQPGEGQLVTWFELSDAPP